MCTMHFCPEKKKGRGEKQEVAKSAKTRLSEFVAKFESDFSLVSYLSTSTVARCAWYLDSDASRHIMGTQELFNRLTESDSRIHVELGDDAKYAVGGEGIVLFLLELGGSFDAQDAYLYQD